MPSEAEIYAALTEVFHDVFTRDDIALRPDFSAKDVSGWDSFKQIEIIVATEARFGIRMTTREIDDLKNVSDLVRVVASKIA